MTLSHRIITIFIILSLIWVSHSAPACTPSACGYCEKNNAENYCKMCYKEALGGTGTQRECKGGTAITGCARYELNTKGDISCTECESPMGLVVAGNTKDNSCVTLIANCATPTSATECKVCKSGYYLNTTAKTCVQANANLNCQVHKDNDAAKCITCNDNYALKTATETC